ncbi:MAG: site-specific DNA-methyltransferase, partial [Selenomonadaceae bacterium]|nr:site-specific DNA-methyltransferase [Selenomonadaceae bacterium]
ARKTYLDKVGDKPPTNNWPFEEVGHTDEAKKEGMAIFGGKLSFDTPKPTRLIERILQIATDKNSIVLDSFAGSGTTAHAVLNLNKQDGGNRKFILIEMMDYAETITAERVRRVISGYGEGKNVVAGTGGGFDFYEIGVPLMEKGFLNENVSPAQIRRYVWYMETHEPPAEGLGEDDFLGIFQDTAYYFYYRPGEATVLDGDYLATITAKAESYVIYADRCLLSEDFMERHHIIFKKIPRDIAVL